MHRTCLRNSALDTALHTGRGTAAGTRPSSLHTLGEPDSNTRSADSPERSESGAAARIHGAKKCRYQARKPSPADGAGRAGAGCQPDVWSVFMPLSHEPKTSTEFDHDDSNSSFLQINLTFCVMLKRPCQTVLTKVCNLDMETQACRDTGFTAGLIARDELAQVIC